MQVKGACLMCEKHWSLSSSFCKNQWDLPVKKVYG